MDSRVRALLLVTAFAVTASCISAQTAPTGEASVVRATRADPQLDALVNEALEKNPDVARAKSLVLAAEARIKPAGALRDPFLSTTYQVDGSNFALGSMNDTWLEVMYAQPLPWPGKRDLERKAAESDAQALDASLVGRTALSIEANVRRAYYDLVLARSLLRLIEDRRASWKQIEGVVRERYTVGLGIQQDLLRAQIELLRLDEATDAQKAIVTSRLAELNRLTGRPQDAPIATPDTLEFRPETLAPETYIESVKAVSPERAAAKHTIESGALRVSSAQKAYRPDFVVDGGLMYRGSLDPMWKIGIGVSLPVFTKSKQDESLRERKEQLNASEEEALSIDQVLELRTRERLANLEAAGKIARLYSEGVLPLDQMSFESAIASYETGKIPFISVLEALNTLYTDRETLLTRLSEIEKWRVAIDEASLDAPGNGMPAGGNGAMALSGGTTASMAAKPPSGESSSSMGQMR